MHTILSSSLDELFSLSINLLTAVSINHMLSSTEENVKKVLSQALGAQDKTVKLLVFLDPHS